MREKLIMPECNSLASANRNWSRVLIVLLTITILLLGVAIICYYALKTDSVVLDTLKGQHEYKAGVLAILISCSAATTLFALLIGAWQATINSTKIQACLDAASSAQS